MQVLLNQLSASMSIIDKHIHLSHWDEVVNLQDHPHALGGELDLRGVDQQRLHDLLGPHVADGTVTHVDATGVLALVVAVPQLGHHADGVDARVLCQRVGDDLQCLQTTQSIIS